MRYNIVVDRPACRLVGYGFDFEPQPSKTKDLVIKLVSTASLLGGPGKTGEEKWWCSLDNRLVLSHRHRLAP